MSMHKSAAAITAILLCSAVGRLDAQTYTLAPPPYQTVLSTAGAIVPNGCVWTYAAGTTTPIATYSDTSGTLNGNPIIADSSGRFVAYLLPGTNYKFTYENVPCSSPSTHGATLKTQDNIQGVPASASNVDLSGTAGEALTAGQCAYLSDGSGSKTPGQWYKCDAANTYSATLPVVGIPIASLASATTGTFRISGSVTGLSSLTVSAAYFVSGTAGALTATAPANRRFLGNADSTTSLVLVANPAIMVAAASGTASTGSFLRGDQTWATVPIQACGRLTLTTATPVTTADVTAATTLYFTPLQGCNQFTAWSTASALQTVTLTETSVAVPATTSQLYDVFAFLNGSAINIELLAWTNDTTRATAITVQNGFLAKSGDATRRYVGSMRTTTVSGQTEDSVTKRYVWNYYNRVERTLLRQDTTASYTYTTATWRQANASTSNQVDVVVGVADVRVTLRIHAYFGNATANVQAGVGFGLDSTTTPSALSLGGQNYAPTATTTAAPVICTLDHYPAVGRHFYVWLEESAATGTTTWLGLGTGGAATAGISGSIPG